MSTLRCIYGYVIRDQDDFYYLDTLSHELALLAANSVMGKREEWISRHFLPGYPRDLSDEKLATQIFECENCGRLWMQKGSNKDTSIPRSPDDGRLHRLFASALHTRSETEY